MGPNLTPEQQQAFADALYSGRKIQAIKQLREASGLGLKEAKDIIDRLEADLRVRHPERFVETGSKYGRVVLVLVILIVGIAFLLSWIFRFSPR